MKILITGAAGNLGSSFARHLLGSRHCLNLMIHQRELPFEIPPCSNVSIFQADLASPETLTESCWGVDCLVHFAGVLFAPQPEKFLRLTNVVYVQNLIDAALVAGVKKFILISFPHVEGESTPERPAQGILGGNPDSVHARTRQQAELSLFRACESSGMTAVSLRAGMIYASGVLMISAARWLMKKRLLGVWKRPTHIHMISLPDFLRGLTAAVEGEHVQGIYNLGDDAPLTLQEFLDRAAVYWGCNKPWRAPDWLFYAAAYLCELYASLFKTASPLTRDFIRIGMASYTMDTSRMKAELISELSYPSLDEGIRLLE